MSNHRIKERPQDHAAASYAPKIEKKITLIDWEQSAAKISALIRALDPSPGAYTVWRDKKVKLFSSGIEANSRPDVVPGRVVGQRERGLIVETGQGAVKILELQYPGKKRLPAQEYLRGFPIPDGTILGR